MNKRYRLYFDESGDHTYNDLDKIEKRYLSLTGVIVETEYYRTVFHPSCEAFKQKHFPHNPDEPLILHRSDIINYRGKFGRLLDAENKNCYEKDLLRLLCSLEYKIITVVLDKKTHIETYNSVAFHPYSYCITAMLERYCGYLNYNNATGDVLGESRGGKEDIQIKHSFKELYDLGTMFRNKQFFQRALTSKEIKLRCKSSNIAGLQIADLIAHPSKQNVLLENNCFDGAHECFGKDISDTIEQKYNRRDYDGRVAGYGKVMLTK